jgi:hypothetical protein
VQLGVFQSPPEGLVFSPVPLLIRRYAEPLREAELTPQYCSLKKHFCFILFLGRRVRNGANHTTHDLYSAKICYRYHPRHGVAVELVRYLRRGNAAVVIVRLPDSSQLATPEWMLKPEACEDLKIEAKPRVSMGALLDLCKLIGTPPSAVADDSHGCAESETGGRDAQQGKSDHTAAQAPLRRRPALDEAARGGAGTSSNSMEGTTGERSQER